MSLPSSQELMLPVLAVLADGATLSTREINDRVAVSLRLSDADLAHLLRSGRQTLFYNRAGWAKYYLVRAKLLRQPKRGLYEITDSGRRVLSSRVDAISRSGLEPSTSCSQSRERLSGSRDSPVATDKDTLAPRLPSAATRGVRRGAPDVVQGALLEGKAVDGEHAARRKSAFEKSLPIGTPVPAGWATRHWHSKSTIRVVKPKSVAELFEDRVWRLLRDIGASHLSTRDFTLHLQLDPEHAVTKRPDVVAVESDKAFIVECHTAQEPASRSMRSRIAELASYKSAMRKALKRILGASSLECIFVVATEGIRWSRSDLDYAASDPIQVHIWTEQDVNGLAELARIAGEGAKYQVYSHVLFGKKVKALRTRLPALRSRMGGHEYFSMIMHPEDLLKIAFVHRRTPTTRVVDVADSYQRMIRPSRLRAIERFIDKERGFFPGSVIVNFTRDVRVDFMEAAPEADDSSAVKPVTLTLPPYYGCAHIIDGQHRLYGYADLDARTSETIPVVAFRDLDVALQARIFVDINQNQKSVPSDVLWDLYEDLYADSQDEMQQRKYCVSAIAKRLERESTSPICSRIVLPSEGRKADPHTRNLTLTAVCASIEREGLVNRSRQLLFDSDYATTSEFAYQRIARFLEIIRDGAGQQWERGDDHYVCTSASMYVYMGILRDIAANLEADEKASLVKFERQVRLWMQPVVKHLATIDDRVAGDYRGPGGAGKGTSRVRATLTTLIAEKHPGFRSRLLECGEFGADRSEVSESTDPERLRLLAQPEGAKLEFKASLSIDLRNFLCGNGQLQRQPRLVNEALKEIVALLNSEGGHLVLGVLEPSRFDRPDAERLSAFPPSPNGMRVCGINLEYNQHGWDSYSTRLIELVESHIGPQPFYNGWIDVRRIEFKGKDVAVVALGRATSAQYLDKTEMYVRIGSHTRKLEGRDIVSYCTQHGLS